MTTFFLDILEDLREKRLVPVAVALALAILATPPLLMKRSGPGAEAAPAPAAASAEKVKPLSALEGVEAHRKPNLKSLAAKNPFDAPVPKLTTLSGAASQAGAKGSETVASGGGESLVDSGSGSGGGSLADLPTGGGDSTEVTTGGGGDEPTSTPKKVTYTFVIDASFGKARHEHDYTGLERFAMLPNSHSPLLVYLGVDSSGDNAIFLVDASLTQSGEGRCGDEACSFIELGVGSEHRFTDTDGDTYVLRLDQIRKVKAGASASASRKARAHTSRSKHRKRAHGPARRFLSPLFGDLVEESVQK
jgi:hypothetical protein